MYYPYWIPDQAGRRYDIPKIHTIILGVLGAIPSSAVRSAEAAGATADSALWHDLTVLLAAGLHGSFSIPAQARRAASSSAPQPQPQGGVRYLFSEFFFVSTHSAALILVPRAHG
jgi:hypothetical protein